MTNLSTALSQALSGLRVSSGQSAIVARNISRAGEDGYTRKYAGLTTDINGSARISSINRNAEKRLNDVLNASISSSESQKLLLGALEQLQQTVGDVEDDSSIAWGINELQNKLKLLEGNPANSALASGVVSNAAGIIDSLHAATGIVQAVRSEADSGLKLSVTNINSLLGQLQEVNTYIRRAPQFVETYVDALDKRDTILQSLSSEIGIRTIQQTDNGIAVYTDGGVTLFNQTARNVSFAPASSLAPSAPGNTVYADGVAIAGSGAQMPPTKGKIATYVDIRDNVSVTYQKQLDETARGLIVAFAENDQSSSPTFPTATGLFSYFGAPATPVGAIVVDGLANSISVNSAYDPVKGGNPMLIRDGGANGANYVYNFQGSPGYQDRIRDLIGSLDASMQFSADTQLTTTASLKNFTQSSAGWVEGLRSEASSKSEYLSSVTARAKEALSSATGVNVDDEMTEMLNLERSYQASAKVITIIDQMFSALLQAVR